MAVEGCEASYLQAIKEAYGLLWLASAADPRVHKARRKLLACLDQEQRMDGIILARSSVQQSEKL